jgi:hypothetical protein
MKIARRVPYILAAIGQESRLCCFIILAAHHVWRDELAARRRSAPEVKR